MWNLNITLLNNQYSKDKLTKEFRKHYEKLKTKQVYQNLWGAAIVLVRGKFIPVNYHNMVKKRKI